MDFDLTQLDEGVPVGKRLWNPYAVVPPTYDGRLGTRDAYMFVINKAEMGGSARAFDMIDRTTKVSGLCSALLQFVLRAVEQVVRASERAKKESMARVPYPLEMFLETVVESEASARSHTADCSGANLRAKIVRQFYQIDTTSDAVAQLYPDRASDESPLMRDARGRLVIQYRLWIIVERLLDFPQKIAEVLQLAVEEREKRSTATTLAIDNRALREARKHLSASSGGDATAQNDTFDMRRVLGQYEQWAVIDSRTTLLDALYLYTGDLRFLNQAARTAASHESLGSPTNPFYLGAVFSAARQFNCLDPRTDPAQARWLAYSGPVLRADGSETGGVFLRFPCPQRVLPVAEEYHSVRFTIHYTPDYQRWNAQRRLLRDDLLRAQAGIAAAPALRRARAASEAVLRAAEAAGLVSERPDADDDDGDDAHLAGGAGDEQREAATRAAAEARLLLASSASSTSLSLADENRAATALVLARAGITQQFAEGDAVQRGDARRLGGELRLDSRYLDPRATEQTKAIDSALSGNLAMSSVHTLAAHYRLERTTLAACTDAQERAVRYTVLQEAAMRDYMLSCTSPLADVSATGRTINAFMVRADAQREAYFRQFKFFDPALSVFGHMMVAEATTQDSVYHTYSVHGLQTVMVAAQFDAYRVAHSLKLNVLVTGPPELGKSRALEHVEARSIPGTLLVAARRTQNSFSASEPHNDECEGYHETPHAWLLNPTGTSQPAAGTGTGGQRPPATMGPDDAKNHEIFKAKLTSMVVRTGDLQKTDGNFNQKTRVSEQMMTYICASNLRVDWMAPAVLSRMFQVQVSDFHRVDTTMGDKGLDEHNMARDAVARRERCDWEFRLLQYLYYHTEKLIAVGALTAPTLTTLMVFQQIFVDVLENRFGIKVSIRSLIKMELLVRHFVIRRALFALYCAPMAPFAGQTVAIEHLLRLDPWLHDDPEILFFVFEFMRSQYVDAHQAVVTRALRTYIATLDPTPALFERYRAMQTARPRGAESVKPAAKERVPIANYVAVMASASSGGDVSSGAGVVTYGSSAAAIADTLARATWADVDAANPAFDFNRFMIRQRLDVLTIELEAIIARDETLRLNREQIGQVLQQMTQQTVTDYEYEPNRQFDGVFGDTPSAFPVVPRTDRPKKSALRVVSAPQHQLVTVHASVLRVAGADPIEEAIRACSDKNLPPQKMLRGEPATPSQPHIYGVRQAEPRPEVTHVVADRTSFLPSVLTMLGEEADGAPVSAEARVERVARERYNAHLRRAVALVGMSVEEYSVRRRLEAINLPEAAAPLFSFRSLGEQISANAQNFVVPAEQINYPAECSIATSQSQFMTDVRTLLAGRTPAEAVELLRGRVTYVYATQPNNREREALGPLFKDLGFSMEISEREYRFRVAEAKRIELEGEKRRAERRAESDKIATEMETEMAKAAAAHRAKQARLTPARVPAPTLVLAAPPAQAAPAAPLAAPPSVARSAAALWFPTDNSPPPLFYPDGSRMTLDEALSTFD